MKNNSNINNVKNNSKKKPLKNKKTVVTLIVSFAFLLYCLILFIKLLANPTDKFVVEQGKIYKEESQVGYIIRDEQVVENDEAGGNIVQLKSEGKKVANGEAIYRYSLENETDINYKIQELDNQIQEALKKENTLFSSDIKLLETQIEDKLENVYESTDINKIEQQKKDINNSMQKKAKIASTLTSNGSYVQQLIETRTNYENQVNSGSKYIYSTKSGIISYKVDGLENKLTVGDFGYLNKDFLNSLNLKTGQIIASNNSKAKIINNFNNYLACVSKSEEAKNSEVGNVLKIRLPNSEEISAQIVHKSDQGNNETLLVFEVKQDVESLINYRKIAFDIIWWSDYGMKVPNKAIKYDGNFAYVIRTRAGYEEKIFVKVLRKNDNYSIVDNYSTQELQEAGYDTSTMENKKSISVYDELVIK
ncbi:MAG: hypothetical protein IKN09_04735 [Clostridia bacterium]|nr:hypothetical protein [Clostridia bacterium]